MRVATIQFDVQEKQTETAFRVKVDGFCRRALEEGAELIVFPELACLDLIDFDSPLEPQWVRLAAIEERLTSQLRAFAKAHRLAVLAPSFPRRSRRGFRNVCSLIDRGRLVVEQVKVHPTPEERSWGWVGGGRIEVFSWRGIRWAILICHDVEFPQLSTRLARQSVDVLLVPSMTSDRYGEQRVHSCAQARTVEHQCFAVVSAIVPAVGTRSEYAGRAAVYAPRTPYFELDGTHGDADAPAIVVADLDLKLLQRSRKDPNTIYPARDTR